MKGKENNWAIHCVFCSVAAGWCIITGENIVGVWIQRSWDSQKFQSGKSGVSWDIQVPRCFHWSSQIRPINKSKLEKSTGKDKLMLSFMELFWSWISGLSREFWEQNWAIIWSLSAHRSTSFTCRALLSLLPLYLTYFYVAAVFLRWIDLFCFSSSIPAPPQFPSHLNKAKQKWSHVLMLTWPVFGWSFS